MNLRSQWAKCMILPLISMDIASAAVPGLIHQEEADQRIPTWNLERPPSLTKTAESAERAQFSQFMINRNADVQALVVKDVSRTHMKGKTVRLEKGDIITMLETKVSRRGEQLVRIGIDSEAADVDLPSDFWVRANELANAALSSYDVSELSEEALALFEQNNEWVGVEEARRHGRGRGGKIRKRRGVTMCYRFVKQYLLRGGLIRYYPGGGHARMALHELGAAGMSRSSCSPSNPVRNCTCVYQGGKSGHVEVYKGGGCWWYGYGCKPAMANLNMGRTGARRLAGCFG